LKPVIGSLQKFKGQLRKLDGVKGLTLESVKALAEKEQEQLAPHP